MLETQETQVWPPTREDPHRRLLAWKISWTEEPGRLQSMGSQSWTRLSAALGITSERSLLSPGSQPPISPDSRQLPLHVPSLYISFACSHTSHEWNHTIWARLCLISLAQHFVFLCDPCYCLWHWFVTFYCQVLFCCMTFEWFPVLAFMCKSFNFHFLA